MGGAGGAVAGLGAVGAALIGPGVAGLGAVAGFGAVGGLYTAGLGVAGFRLAETTGFGGALEGAFGGYPVGFGAAVAGLGAAGGFTAGAFVGGLDAG